MPTIVTSEISSLGDGDYLTPQAWADDSPADLVAADTVWRGVIKHAEDFSSAGAVLSLSGVVTDATRYRELTVASGSSLFDDPTNPIRFDSSKGASFTGTGNATVIYINEQYSRISRLQIRSNGAPTYLILPDSSSPNLWLDKLLVESNGGNLLYCWGNEAKITNSVFIQRGASATNIINIDADPSLRTFENCTFVVPSDVAAATNVFSSDSASLVDFINCAFFGCTNITTSTGTYNYTNCVSDVASPPTGVTTSTYPNAKFLSSVDSTRDFRHTFSSTLIDAGVDNADTSTDIFGTARPSGDYDVGAFQYVYHVDDSSTLYAPLTSALTLTRGSGTITHTRASSATYFDGAGVLQTVGNNVARFQDGRYLGEPAATNDLRFSRDMLAGARSRKESEEGVTASAVWIPSTFGAELSPNTTMDNTIGFETDISNCTPTSVSGQLVFTVTVAGFAVAVSDSMTVEADEQYLVSVDFISQTGNNNIFLETGTDASGGNRFNLEWIDTIDETGTYKFVTIPTGTTLVFTIETLSAAVDDTFTIDNLTIKKCAVKMQTNQTGVDGSANAATLLTASTSNATVFQPLTLAAASRSFSCSVKRSVGTGTIEITRDGGATYTDITSLINSSTYTRVTIEGTSVLNPQVGFRIATSGDAIIVDVNQDESGARATNPIHTTTATASRSADLLTIQTSGNFSDTQGGIAGDFDDGNWSAASGKVGSATTGLHLSASNSGVQALDGTNTVSGPTGTPTDDNKLAIGWAGSTLKAASGGTLGTAGSYDGSFGLSDIQISGYTSLKDLHIWTDELSDSELQQASGGEPATDITINGNVATSNSLGVSGSVIQDSEIDGAIAASASSGVAGQVLVNVLINATPAQSTSAGVAGSVSLDYTLNGSIANSSSAGVTGQVLQHININGSIADSASSGVTGQVLQHIDINGTIATSSSTGVAGEIIDGTVIQGNIATSSSVGISGQVIHDTLIDASVATSSSTGITGLVLEHILINAGIATSSSVGVAGSIVLTDDTIINGSIATSQSSGVAGNVLIGTVIDGNIATSNSQGITGEVITTINIDGNVATSSSVGVQGTIVTDTGVILNGTIATSSSSGVRGYVEAKNEMVTLQGIGITVKIAKPTINVKL